MRSCSHTSCWNGVPARADRQRVERVDVAGEVRGQHVVHAEAVARAPGAG